MLSQVNIHYLLHLLTYELNYSPAPDILRFPISLLTVSALISGIIVSLIGHYESEADIYYWQRQRAQGCVCRSSDITERGAEEDQMRRNYMRCAVQATESIITDFQDILLIQTVSVAILKIVRIEY